MNGVGVRAALAIGASLQFAMSTICAGQQPRALTPVQVVQKFLAAKDAENWREAAQYLDVAPIDSRRRDYLRTADDAASGPPLTVDEVLRHNPDMPRLVAEYQLKQFEKARGSFDPVRYEFADVKDRAALARLTPHQLAISWLKARSFRYQMALATSMSPQCVNVPPSVLPKEPHAIVGVVQRGTRAYVVDAPYRPEHEGKERGIKTEYEPPPTIFELRNVGGGWKLLPPSETGGVAVSCDVTDMAGPKAKK